MSDTQNSGACLVIGAGDDTGAAIGRIFSAAGYHACLVRRPRHADRLEALAADIRAHGDAATAFPVDARDEAAVTDLVARIEQDIGPIEIAVFNIGANVNFSILDMTAQVYRKVWEMACFAGFLMGRSVAQRMVARQRGTIIFTGATASVRGGKGYAAFASAKHGLRALAQSMARELGPQNIHVAHVIVDGAIDSGFIRENLPGVDDARRAEGLLAPDDIARTYLWLHQQARTAWTQELDLRPWSEKW